MTVKTNFLSTDFYFRFGFVFDQIRSCFFFWVENVSQIRFAGFMITEGISIPFFSFW